SAGSWRSSPLLRFAGGLRTILCEPPGAENEADQDTCGDTDPLTQRTDRQPERPGNERDARWNHRNREADRRTSSPPTIESNGDEHAGENRPGPGLRIERDAPIRR